MEGITILKNILFLLGWCILLAGCNDPVKEDLLEVNGLADRNLESYSNEREQPPKNNVQFPSSFEEFIMEEFHEPTPEEIKADTSKIYYLALGDSLTEGVGDEERKKGYTERLAEKIENESNISEVVIDNRGKRGRKSNQLLNLLQKGHYDQELKNSELISITIGGNDIMEVLRSGLAEVNREDFDRELVAFQQRYDQILTEIRNRNSQVPIIVIGLYNPLAAITDEIPEFESVISEWNLMIEATSLKYDNACYIHVQDLFDKNANMVYHTDFFHPNGYGYTIMTERIISLMKSCQIENSRNGLILFK